MIVDMYNSSKEDPSYTKLVGSDYMIMEYKCPIDTKESRVMTEMHVIIYVITGRKDWITPDQICSANEGDAIFIRRGVYTIHQNFDVDHCILTFFINDDFIRKFQRENASIVSGLASNPQFDQIYKLEVNDSLRSLFMSVYNYMRMGGEIPKNLVEIKFKELMFNIILNPKHSELTQFFSSLNQTHRTNIEHAMNNSFRHDLQLEEFARLCGRSLSAFKRDFQHYYHLTPGKWLREKRLDYASALLLSSDLNVNEICYESGFNNSSHFNKVFKERFQLSPNQFREKWKSHKAAVRSSG